MKGYIMLSEGRSGSTWLGSLANSTRRMGHLDEWLGEEHHDREIATLTPQELVAEVMKRATTENGRFAVKLFPRHLHHVHLNLGFDFIRRCMQEHETSLVLLTREDRLAQAISFVRGIQTSQWTSCEAKRGTEEYDFAAIGRAYFYISRSYDFWDAYLGVNQYPHQRFTYEQLLGDPGPFLHAVQEALGVEGELEFKTDLKIQRDDKTLEWRQRFLDDVKKRDVIGLSGSFGAFGWFAQESLPQPKSSLAGKLKSLFR